MTDDKKQTTFSSWWTYFSPTGVHPLSTEPSHMELRAIAEAAWNARAELADAERSRWIAACNEQYWFAISKNRHQSADAILRILGTMQVNGSP